MRRALRELSTSPPSPLSFAEKMSEKLKLDICWDNAVKDVKYFDFFRFRRACPRGDAI